MASRPDRNSDLFRHVDGAAARLGVKPTTFAYRIKKLGIMPWQVRSG